VTVRPSEPAEIVVALEALVRAPAPLLVVADFDGTLARGSRDPGAARIVPLARRSLRRLARFGEERPGRLHLAILTGRIVSDVAARVRVGGIEYLGDHGLQSATLPRGGRVGTFVGESEPMHDRHRAAADLLATRVPARLGNPGWLFVERKGPSVAFHVRQADDVPAARSAVLAAISEVELEAGLTDHGLRHYRGRSVVDLRPEGAGGKAEAVTRLLERHRPGAVLALGDDVSDADGFAVLRAARAAGRLHPLAAAVIATGMPDEVAAAADVRLADADAAARLLSSLARMLDATDRSVVAPRRGE
jgi:trehalose-phosphatase